MTDIEERLRIGLNRRADAALPGDAVRAALAAGSRSAAPGTAVQRIFRRPGRGSVVVWLAVATAVVAIAVGVPLGLRAVADRQPAARPTLPSVTVHVGWVPPGFTLRHLETGPRTQLLEWENGPTDHPTKDSVTVTYTSTADPDAARIAHGLPKSSPDKVNGRPAQVQVTGKDSLTLSWLAGPDRLARVLVWQVSGARTVAFKVADSVTTTAPQPVRAGIAFGWLPAGLHLELTGVYGPSPAMGSSVLMASPTGGPTSTQLYAQVTTTPMELEYGTPVMVRGLPGRYERDEGRNMAMLTVQMLDGRSLTVYSNPSTGSPLSEADLVRVADGIVFDSVADYSRLGQ